jgi:ABC-type spermidine/putrescine transport system permease subunit I
MKNTFLSRKSLTVLVLLVSSPVLIITWMAFFSNDAFPNQVSFSLSGFAELLSPLRLNEILKIAKRALIVCLTGTAISFFISYLLMLHTSKLFQYLFFILITLPFLVNESVRVFSWQYVLSQDGIFNQILSLISGNNVIYFNGSNYLNVYVVMILTCIPFGIFINSASLGTIPPIYWAVSNDLNLNSFHRFLKVAIPLSKFGLIASLIVIFFLSFSLSTEVNFLGGDSKISIRNLVLSLMSASKFQSIFVLGFLITLFLLFSALFYKIFTRKSIS